MNLHHKDNSFPKCDYLVAHFQPVRYGLLSALLGLLPGKVA